MPDLFGQELGRIWRTSPETPNAFVGWTRQSSHTITMPRVTWEEFFSRHRDGCSWNCVLENVRREYYNELRMLWTVPRTICEEMGTSTTHTTSSAFAQQRWTVQSNNLSQVHKKRGLVWTDNKGYLTEPQQPGSKKLRFVVHIKV